MAEMKSFDMLKEIFNKLENRAEAKELMKMYDQTVQFEITDEESFIIEFKNGKTFFKKEKKNWPPATRAEFKNLNWLRTDKKTLKDIFQGTMGPMEAFYKEKLWISGLMPKQHIDSWLFRQIRMIQDLRLAFL